MIREAVSADIDGILELGLECHEKAATEFRVDKAQARRIIAQFVNSKSKFAMVKEADGELLGCLLGGMAQVWYSPDKEASDLLLYVRTDPRSVGAGTMLVKRFIRWARENGAKGMSMAVSFGGPTTPVTGKIFRKLGFDEVGGIFYLHGQKFQEAV